MKHFLVAIAAALILMPLSPAFADVDSDNGPGCGLGKLLFGEMGGNSSSSNKVLIQVLASTTNGTFGSQTFGITSGTSGCTNDGFVKNDKKVDVFASVNFENLKENMAQGQGEYLTSFATLLGVTNDLQPEFFALTHDKYTSLIQSDTTTSTEMLVSLKQEMASDPMLSGVLTQ
jgi:hypothetical protein